MLLFYTLITLPTLLVSVLAQRDKLPACWQAALERLRAQINSGYCDGTGIECLCRASENYGLQNFASKSCLEQGGLVQAETYLSSDCSAYYRGKVSGPDASVSLMLPTIAATADMVPEETAPPRPQGMSESEKVKISTSVIFSVIGVALIGANVWYKCGPGRKASRLRSGRPQSPPPSGPTTN